jgi:hypothetical protein
MEGTCALAGNAADSSPDMGDLFADADPLDAFHFEYILPLIKSVNEALNPTETMRPLVSH